MNKFKRILLGTLSVLTLGLFVVTGTKVMAETHEIGSETVTTTTNSGDTKTWDFKVKDAKTLADGDDVNGVVVYGGWNVNSASGKTKAAAPSIKKDNAGLDFYWKGYILVPVVSSSSTGKINIGLTSNNNQRYLQLINNAGAVSSYAITASTMSFDFDADDVWNIGTNYYVKVMSAIVSTKSDYSTLVTCEAGQETSVTCSSSGEIKMGSVQIVLDNETYGSAATLHTVTYMDGTKTLLTDDKAVDGSNVSYEPKKYGYDFEGWYTNSSLSSETKINKETYTVTTDVTLYANWTVWTNTGIEELTLSNAAIEKIKTGIDGNLSADLALAPSIYTAMTGVGMTTTDVILPGESSSTQTACFNTNGAVKTDGNGLKFTAPANGTLTAYVGSGGGSQRNIKLTDGTDVLDPTTGSVVVGNIESARYTPVEITYTLEKGTTYYFGGDNGVRIYYISFEPEMAYGTQAMVQAEKNSTGDTVRFIGGILLNDLDLANVQSIELILKLDGVATSKQIFLTTCYTSVTGASIACPETKGVYYVIYRVTGVKDLTGTISKQLKVTFTDGSTTLSEVTEITL